MRLSRTTSRHHKSIIDKTKKTLKLTSKKETLKDIHIIKLKVKDSRDKLIKSGQNLEVNDKKGEKKLVNILFYNFKL